jgi:mannose-6-phosphate isomerase
MDSPSASSLYPLELSLYRLRATWGGWPDGVGEILSLSGPPHESLVLNGSLAGRRLTEFVARYPSELLGKGMELDAREPFPLRLRFLCTSRDLPVILHPNDSFTMARQIPMVGQEKVVTILEARRGARLYCGMKEEVSRTEFLNAVCAGKERDLLHALHVRPGEVYTIPPGRPYSLGAGISLCEIARHSDAAFRMTPGGTPHWSDDLWDILEKGPVRPEPISGISTPSGQSRIDYLCYTPRFSLRRFSVVKSLDLTLTGDRFRVYAAIRGSGWLKWGLSATYCPLQPHQAVLVPALPAEDICLESEAGMVALEASMPNLARGALREVAVPGISPSAVVSLGGRDYSHILKEYLRR